MFLTKLQSIQRYIMVKGLSKQLPLYVINEYPKSGGTWAGQLISTALQLPFPRNQFRPLKSCVIHGHFLNPRAMHNVVCVWRDGRDLMVSWYYHCLFRHEYDNQSLVEKVRHQLQFSDCEDIYQNLPQFIEYSLTQPYYPRFTWTDFVINWHHHSNAVHLHYEDLHQKPVENLIWVVQQLSQQTLEPTRAKEIVAQFSFQRQKKSNQKHRFLRKGIVGDWKNHFSPEAKQVFNHYAGNALILMGYENSQAWVTQS